MTLLAGDCDQPGHAGGVTENEAELAILPSHGISIDMPDTAGGATSPPIQHPPSPSYKSPLRHHQRNPSHHREVKETLNAHSEYTNNEEDGKAEHHLNQYVIKDEIGRGSFGAVHLAVDQNGTEYAVKEFSKSRLRKRAQSNILRRPHGMRRLEHLSAGLGFNAPLHRHSASDIHNNEEQGNPLYLIREEIAIMKKLNHPNLVSLIEVLDDPEEDSLYMVLEMCKKGVIMRVGLNERAEPYDVESCRCWFRDLILGIEYLHAQGVVHRDIKPDNLLITEDDVLKIVDFGVSEMFEKSSEMKTAKSAGSPAFLPPELCVTKHGDISGKAADIWSMGVSLYCLRFGRIPFDRTGVLEMYEAIKNNAVEYDSDCEPELQDLLNRLLDKDPKTRITMAELREHPWVTNSGEDPLLSTEENTADFIESPSDIEVHQAITTTIRNLIVLMKAVSKFKNLNDKKKPTAVGDTSGDGGGNLQSPGEPDSTGTPVSEPVLQMSPNADLHERRNFDAVLAADGIHHSITGPPSSLVGHTGGDSPATRSDSSNWTPRSHVASPSSTGGRSSSSDMPKPGHPERHRTSSSDKSHAHDPLTDEPLFLHIGAGKNNSLEVTDEDVIAESPLAAEFNIYDLAYQQEVERIREEQGHRATVYLNRRVENKEEYKKDESMVKAEEAHSGWSQLLNRVREKEKENEPHSGV